VPWREADEAVVVAAEEEEAVRALVVEDVPLHQHGLRPVHDPRPVHDHPKAQHNVLHNGRQPELGLPDRVLVEAASRVEQVISRLDLMAETETSIVT
jgi:hypothetical protein